MADDTPRPSTPDDAGEAKKPARKATARKAPARKAAAGKKPVPRAAAKAAEPAAASASAAPTAPPAAPEPAPQPAAQATVPDGDPATSHKPGRRSILDGVRANRMGPVTAALVVALVVGLLLSVLVPSEPNVLAMVILGALLTAAIGFTVRYLASGADLRLQVATFAITVIGVHVMSVTGSVGGDVPLLSQLGVQGPGFDDALLAALGTPPVSAGGILAGVVSAIIVGWGERQEPRPSE